jgi:hypothetical protein
LLIGSSFGADSVCVDQNVEKNPLPSVFAAGCKSILSGQFTNAGISAAHYRKCAVAIAAVGIEHS